MLTWVIVKTIIDSSLNLYEHCVACDDENNCPAGQLYGANPAGPLTPLTMLRLALYTACRGVKTPRKAVYSHILSPKMASAVRTASFYQHKYAPKTSAFWRILGVFWLYPGKKPVLGLFWPILRSFLAPTESPAGQQGSLGPKMGYPLRADHLSWIFEGAPLGAVAFDCARTAS